LGATIDVLHLVYVSTVSLVIGLCIIGQFVILVIYWHRFECNIRLTTLCSHSLSGDRQVTRVTCAGAYTSNRVRCARRIGVAAGSIVVASIRYLGATIDVLHLVYVSTVSHVIGLCIIGLFVIFVIYWHRFECNIRLTTLCSHSLSGDRQVTRVTCAGAYTSSRVRCARRIGVAASSIVVTSIRYLGAIIYLLDPVYVSMVSLVICLCIIGQCVIFVIY
jgi:hypothetical protein